MAAALSGKALRIQLLRISRFWMDARAATSPRTVTSRCHRSWPRKHHCVA